MIRRPFIHCLILAAVPLLTLVSCQQGGKTEIQGQFPEFSWDHVPLYMHMRKSEAFTREEGYTRELLTGR